MDKKEFKEVNENIISVLTNIVAELEILELLENTPMIYKYSEIVSSVNNITEVLFSIEKFKRVLPIRTERIRIMKEKQKLFYDKLRLEGKELHEDYPLRTWTYDEWIHAFSWDE